MVKLCCSIFLKLMNLFFALREFEEVLKQMHWPFISSAVPVTALGMPGAELQNKMEDLFTQLLHLQLPYPSAMPKI